VKAESWGRVMRGAVTVSPAAPRWSRPAWIGHNVVHHQSVPNEQSEQRPGGRAGQASTLDPSACALFREISGRPAISCVDRRPATRPYSVRLLARHHVLQKPGEDREDRAASATADDLTDDSSDIEAATGRACDRWHRG
jgi:hypothetical protein